MQCERCGTEFPEGATSCVKCGAPPPAAETIRSDAPLPEAAPTVKAEEIPDPVPAPTVKAEETFDPTPAPVVTPGAPIGARETRSGCGKACLWAVLGCSGLALVSVCLCLVVSVVGINLVPSQFPIPVDEVLDLAEEMDPTGDQIPWEELFAIVSGMTAEELGFTTQEFHLGDGIEPTATSSVIATHTTSPPTSTEINYDGIALTQPTGIEFDIVGQTIPADLEMEFWNTPEHVEFHLETYPLTGTFHDPRIMIYPVDDYVLVNPNVVDEIAALMELLEQRPSDPEYIPFVPIWNAGPAFHAQIEYVDFESGAGIRFLTRYGQDAWPISNQEMFYGYQGVTQDGTYLVSAVLPAAHPLLPEDGQSYIGDDYDGFIAGYEAYIATITEMLNNADPSTFTPELMVLDALMESVRIEP